MTTLRAVVEIEPWADDDEPWRIENAEPYRWEALNGSTTPATIGTVMAALAKYCRPEDTDDEHEPTATEALRWIAAADYLIVNGGIQARDAKTTVDPGCCADLEGWHAWPDTWLGHPTPRVAHSADGSLTICADAKSQDSVKIDPGVLPDLLATVREDLIAFLGAVEQWAVGLGAEPDLVSALIANIDRHVAITKPAPPAPPTP